MFKLVWNWTLLIQLNLNYCKWLIYLLTFVFRYRYVMVIKIYNGYINLEWMMNVYKGLIMETLCVSSLLEYL